MTSLPPDGQLLTPQSRRRGPPVEPEGSTAEHVVPGAGRLSAAQRRPRQTSRPRQDPATVESGWLPPPRPRGLARVAPSPRRLRAHRWPPAMGSSARAPTERRRCDGGRPDGQAPPARSRPHAAAVGAPGQSPLAAHLWPSRSRTVVRDEATGLQTIVFTGGERSPYTSGRGSLTAGGLGEVAEGGSPDREATRSRGLGCPCRRGVGHVACGVLDEPRAWHASQDPTAGAVPHPAHPDAGAGHAGGHPVSGRLLHG